MTTLYGKQAKELLANSLSDYEELSEDQQIKICHVGCEAGTDTKNRLYVKRVDEAYLMHCHHCGVSGYYRPRDSYKRIQELGSHTTPSKVSTYSRDCYINANYEYDTFSTTAKLWLGTYEFNKQLVESYYIREHEKGVCLPIFDVDYNVVGSQMRLYKGKPKYMTSTDQDFSYLHSDKRDVVVITEDLLSSYKLNSVGYPTLCLLGTKLSTAAKTLLVTSHMDGMLNRAVVWLDDDLAGHQGSVTLLRELNVLISTTAMFSKQPKEIGLSELKSMEI